jgi:hypothetical protein
MYSHRSPKSHDQHTLLHRSQRIATAHLVIASTVLGDRAGITGAAAMVADAIFGRRCRRSGELIWSGRR